MDQVVRQMRETAEKMRGQLPADQIAQMLRDADELERETKAGSFNAPAAPATRSAGVIAHMEQSHGAIFEWLMRTSTCAGYQWENWRRWNISTGQYIAERNEGCKKAFASYEQYFRAQVSGNGEIAKRHLAEYDRAAHQVVDAYPEN
ncbi:hypothetical protein GCM10022211_26400 [Sphingomonas humi]|uniref:Uncharacterized protein n=2 Tax=Sphingomonas humi TaxID=335630 RepID=A0ABP7SE96_9SPHN